MCIYNMSRLYIHGLRIRVLSNYNTCDFFFIREEIVMDTSPLFWEAAE